MWGEQFPKRARQGRHTPGYTPQEQFRHTDTPHKQNSIAVR